MNKSMEKLETIANYKPTDSGINGKYFEGLVKMAINGKISTKYAVSSKGKTDLTANGYKIEVKSGCGTLENIDKADFVIYSHDATMENALAFTSADFVKIVDLCGMRRTKKMNDGTRKETLQSFRNSRKKFTLWTETLKAYGKDIETFKNIIGK